MLFWYFFEIVWKTTKFNLCDKMRENRNLTKTIIFRTPENRGSLASIILCCSGAFLRSYEKHWISILAIKCEKITIDLQKPIYYKFIISDTWLICQYIVYVHLQQQCVRSHTINCIYHPPVTRILSIQSTDPIYQISQSPILVTQAKLNSRYTSHGCQEKERCEGWCQTG